MFLKIVLKLVFIIAIVAVAMIGVMVPSVFAQMKNQDKNQAILIESIRISQQENRVILLSEFD